MHTTAMSWLDHEHQYVQQALTLLAAAVETDACPQPGSREFQLLERAAAFFRDALPVHIRQEERVLFPSVRPLLLDPSLLEALYEEHLEILLVAEAFKARVAAVRRHPDRLHWAALRHLVRGFEELLYRHMDAELALLAPLAPALRDMSLSSLAS